MVCPNQDRDGSQQGDLILDRRQPSDGSDNDNVRPEKARGRQAGWRIALVEQLHRNPVVDLPDLRRRHSDRFTQPDLQVTTDGNIPVDQRADRPAQGIVPAIPSMQIEDIPPVLAVDSLDVPEKGRRDLALQRGQIAGMDNAGPQLPQDTPESEIHQKAVSGWLPQADNGHIRPGNTPGELPGIRQTNDRMSISTDRGPIDKVDKPVLHAPGIQPEDDMDDERNLRLPGGHGAGTAPSRTRRTLGPISARKPIRIASASASLSV